MTPPATPAAAVSESGHERIRRLCNELSDALSEYCEGHFGAEIMPRSIEPKHPIILFDVASRNEALQRYGAIIAGNDREARSERSKSDEQRSRPSGALQPSSP